MIHLLSTYCILGSLLPTGDADTKRCVFCTQTPSRMIESWERGGTGKLSTLLISSTFPHCSCMTCEFSRKRSLHNVPQKRPARGQHGLGTVGHYAQNEPMPGGVRPWWPWMPRRGKPWTGYRSEPTCRHGLDLSWPFCLSVNTLPLIRRAAEMLPGELMQINEIFFFPSLH